MPAESSARPSYARNLEAIHISTGMDEEYIVVFCKFDVRSGGYVVIIMPFYKYDQWFQFFNNCGSELMQHMYVIMYDCTTVQKWTEPTFTKQVVQFALTTKFSRHFMLHSNHLSQKISIHSPVNILGGLQGYWTCRMFGPKCTDRKHGLLCKQRKKQLSSCANFLIYPPHRWTCAGPFFRANTYRNLMSPNSASVYINRTTKWLLWGCNWSASKCLTYL